MVQTPPLSDGAYDTPSSRTIESGSLDQLTRLSAQNPLLFAQQYSSPEEDHAGNQDQQTVNMIS